MSLDNPPSPTQDYSDENPKFRKACIRTRLADIKAERDALLAEREKIEKTIEAGRKVKGSKAATSDGSILKQ